MAPSRSPRPSAQFDNTDVAKASNGTAASRAFAAALFASQSPSSSRARIFIQKPSGESGTCASSLSSHGTAALNSCSSRCALASAAHSTGCRSGAAVFSWSRRKGITRSASKLSLVSSAEA